MANLYTHRDSNIRKTWFLITVFLLLVIGIGWILSYAFETTAILVLAVVISVGMSFSSYWWSDKLVLAMSRAKPIAKADAPELYRLVENLSITAGLPMPRLYVLNEEAPNAFATGRNPEHAVVAVTTGLLRRLNRSELEGVLAHELSHIGNRDMLISTVVVVLAGVIIFATDILGRSLLWGSVGGRDRRGSGATLAIGFVALLIASVVATLLKLAISRKRELLADASGALLTRYPEGLASALEKISAYPTRLSVASNATAHLYFENPFKSDKTKGGGTSWFARLFLTHPPVEERVAALRGMSAEK
jgi:heat shock protein HtpX